MKFDDTPSREEREDFWLDLGPASAYEGLDCCETARRDGDASPDGLAHGFERGRKPERPRGPARRRPGQRTGAASAAPAESAGVAGHDGQPR